MFIYLALFTQVQLQVLPSIKDTLFIDEWLCLGPFSIGVREAIVDADPAIETAGYKPETLRTYPTILADGGVVKWQKTNSDSGNIRVEYKNVPWDTLQDIYGFIGLLNATYAWAEFGCDKDYRVLINAQGIGSFVLNGRSFPGDAYGDGYFRVPVVLKKGTNTIVLKLSDYGDHEASFRIEPVAEPLRIVAEDVLVADLIVGEKTAAYIGVPVMNTTEKRLDQIIIEVTGELIKPSSRTLRSLMPLSCIKAPLAIETRDIVGSGDSTQVEIKLSSGDLITRKICWLKIKNSDSSYARTFLSKIDNSCQYYAVLPPADYGPDSTYALIMTCHGAGVEARGQVGAYTQKDWAYVVAPTNRRRFGFDWQDWGRLDFLEVLDEVKKNYKTDENRVYLTGHSMGGHGVWHIGLSHPDLFAAIAPSAGWTTIQLYAPFTLQKSYLFAEPEQLKYRDMVMREDNPALFLENALNLPIYILHGGADDNVPPVQARLMNKYLSGMHKIYIYNEVPDMSHWWDIDSTPGTDCVDLKEMMEFMKKQTRNPWPQEVRIRPYDLAQTNNSYWIHIDELEKLYHSSELTAQQKHYVIDDYLTGGFEVDDIKMSWSNVKAATISFKTKLEAERSGFSINGKQSIFSNGKSLDVSIYKEGNNYKIGKPKEHGLKKIPELYGPIKRAFFSPFILVYGTTGEPMSTENNLHLARSYAYTWWIRANGFVEILPDTEVTEEITEQFNMILFGNNETNSYVKYINYKLPINIEYGHFRVGKERLDADDLCLMEIYPNPLNKERFVLVYAPASAYAEKHMSLFPVLYSGSGLPDFIIWDASAARFGWAGVVACGFFDQRWQLDRKSMFLKE
ncbi:MAG TPA: prolyl oligopeptidase family serine peptidase [bacterium]